ncbi:hypothetical protein [Rummeliibacillus pycnus]|uniref:hypothetical protein n=1 Tax=Rummeliibacillus pycnus TaxID=101070 RepID=UPI003D274C5B
MEEVFLAFILMIPLYVIFIWTYFDPEESILFGKRWMYKEEPELSEGVIRYTEIASMVSIIFLTVIFGVLIYTNFFD